LAEFLIAGRAYARLSDSSPAAAPSEEGFAAMVEALRDIGMVDVVL
jgi:hypothetical protein